VSPWRSASFEFTRGARRWGVGVEDSCLHSGFVGRSGASNRSSVRVQMFVGRFGASNRIIYIYTVRLISACAQY
jgi:hypothetical protein